MTKQPLLLALCLSFTSMLSANTFTVNNNTPSPGQYTTILAAMTAAANGDTILVHGSPTTYFIGANITKSLTIIGTGHTPVKDNPLVSKLIFSGLSINASNVTLKGFALENGFYIQGSNVTISDCILIQVVIYYTVTGLVLRNNIFSTANYNAVWFEFVNPNATPNILIENNLFTAGVQIHGAGNAKDVTFKNNVFLGSSTSALNLIFSGTPDNWIFQNNIFWNRTIAPSAANSAFINNISYSPNGDANVPITNGGLNVGNINANPLLVTYSGGGIAAGQDLHLQPGSPGILAGSDGTDIGMYGSAIPHTDHGMPNIPVMQSMTITSGAVPVGGTIQVTVVSHVQN